MRGYRHEQKYYITDAEHALLSRKLALTMDRDAHAQASGAYHVRSLYFDDYMDSAFREKFSGIETRDKYRIRIYNLRSDVIRLEHKHKQGAYVQKQSLPLTKAECAALMRGDCLFLLKKQERVADEMYAAFRTKHLKPRVLVDYTREAFVFAIEDVRVTFDIGVRTAHRFTDIFDKNLPTYPATGDYGIVLEVKFNEYLPGYIRTLLQPMKNAERSAISKYCLCRRFEYVYRRINHERPYRKCA